MNNFHTLSKTEILSLPVGRILNTFIEEYVVRNPSARWSNGQQKSIQCYWFEEHPRACAEDDGGYCTADGLPDYSRNTDDALKLQSCPALKDKSLVTKTMQPTDRRSEYGKADGIAPPNTEYWATFSNIAFGDKNYNWTKFWCTGETLAVAICRAALVAV